jgi:hypothetical protein
MSQDAPAAPASSRARSPKELLRHLKRSVVGPKVKQVRERLDDNEVRNARRLVKAVRSDQPPDVVAFGDSNWVFRAGYDEDQRNLGAMIAGELGPDISFHVCASAGYYSALERAYIRQIRINGGRPVIVVPLCARLAQRAWCCHPRYTYAEAIAAIDAFDERTPTWKIRARFPEPTPADYARYGQTEVTTFVGTTTVDELRSRILKPEQHGIDETERRRWLYAYHHGERVPADSPDLEPLVALGQELRELGSEIVVFETTHPVDEGVALWGEQFREVGANNLRVMREALERGYGAPIDVLECGMACDRSMFIDPADGSEHLNQRGRQLIAGLLAERIRAAVERQRA